MVPITKNDFDMIEEAVVQANKGNTPLTLIFDASAYPTELVVESTRKAFEADFIKSLLPIGISEEELREDYLQINALKEYINIETNIEWMGWKRGVLHGYELWGKR